MSPRLPGHWTTILLAALLTPASAMSQALHDPDNGVITGIFHFVDSTEGAVLAPQGRFQVSTSVVTSSHAIDQQSGAESLFLDGETTRLQLGLRRGLGERWEIGVDIPYLWHSAGELDSVIDSWHDFFGFPEGTRGTQEKDQLEFRYQNADGTSFDIQRSSRGVGDIRLTAGFSIVEDAERQMALRFGATVPTGDSDDLHGTGAASLGIGLATDYQNLGGTEALNGYYRVHATWLDEPDLLASQYRDFVGHVAAGLGYDLTPGVELRLQAMARTAVYHSDTEILGEPSVVLTFGSNFRLSPDFTLSLAVGEDIKVRSAPDVSFQVALRYTPR